MTRPHCRYCERPGDVECPSIDTFSTEQEVPPEVADVVETLLAPWDDGHVAASYWIALRQLVQVCLDTPCHAWQTAREHELDWLSEGRSPMDYWDKVATIVLDYQIMQHILREVVRCRESGLR